MTRSDLLRHGMTDRGIRAAVERGELVRARRGHFVPAGWDGATLRAIHVGGRLDCVSELRQRGIWVLDSGILHVRVDPHATRLRMTDGVRLHWDALAIPVVTPDPSRIDLVNALVRASQCLDHRAWIASVDSALHVGMLPRPALSILSRALPAAQRHLVTMTDGRAESGLESIVRVIARELGFRVRSQVVIRGIGRVDLVVEDWIVVETDGSAFHDVAMSSKDRLRDARLAASGRSVLRPGYSLVVFDQVAVARQLIGAVAAHRRVKNSGWLAARAFRRLQRMSFSGVVDAAGS